MVERPRLTPAIADARRSVRELYANTIKSGDRVLLAVSGGPDSLALVAASVFESKKLKLELAALVVDHGLQPGSDLVAKQAVETCKLLGVKAATSVRVKVEAKGEGLEAAARAARYAALDKHAQEISATAIALGHNLEDQAETVMLGISRGSGLTSISGMPEVSHDGKYLRPFLALPRQTLRQSLTDLGVSFWDDPQNSDRSFKRVRVRQLLETLGSELGPGFVAGLSRTAILAAEADQVLTELALAAEKGAFLGKTAKTVSYSVALLPGEPGIRRKCLHLIATRAGAKALSRTQVLAVDALVTNWHGQKSVVLSGITVERVTDQLVFRSNKPPTPGAC